ncbi:MAG: Ig domain-containing protein, partial [Acutalibacteraceae bacterium]
MKKNKRLAKRTKTIAIFAAAILMVGTLVAILPLGRNWLKADAASVTSASLADMRARAESIVNYEWTPSQDIATWNGNSYNGSTYFKAGTTVKGMPYTLFTSEIVGDSLLSLAQYKNVASQNYSVTKYCNSVGATRTGPVYGSCCATFVSEVFGGSFMSGSNPRYDSVKGIEGSAYANHITNAKAEQIQAGDALSKSGHIIWIGEVTDSSFVVYEQTPPIARKVVVSKSSSINSSGYFVYDGSVYKTITRINVTGGSSPSLTAPVVTTAYKYYAENAQVTINWNAVSGATNYWLIIWKDGEQIFSEPVGNVTSYPFDTTKGNYEVYVDATNSSTNALSSCCQFYAGYLEKPVPTTKSKYYAENAHVTVTWDACEGTEYYRFIIWKDGEQIFSEEIGDVTSYTFDTIKGYYEIYVQACNSFGGWQSVTSECCQFYAGILEKPVPTTKSEYYAENAHVTVTWDACEGTEYYRFIIWKDGEQIFSEEIGDVTSYTFDTIKGYYEIYVQACNSFGGWQSVTSECCQFYVGVLEQPVISNTEMYYEENSTVKINWNECEGATKYHIAIWKPDKRIVSEDVYGTSYDFKTDSGYFGVYVDAINENGGFQSVLSEKYNFYVGNPATPIIYTARKYYIPNSVVTLSWNKCDGAYEYWVDVWKDGSKIVSRSAGTETSWNFSTTDYGTYKVVVTANYNNGKSVTSNAYNVYVPSISLNKTSAKLNLNSSLTLKATTKAYVSSDTVAWKSSNTSVATVSSRGQVKAVGAGKATITATAGTASATCEVEVISTVSAKAKTLAFTEVTPALYMGGETGEFTIAITSPENCTDTIKWTTSNKSVINIIDVSADGKTITIQSGKKGTATITAKSGSGKKVSYKVTSVNQSAESVVLNKYSADIYVGKTVSLRANKILPRGCNDVVIWESSDESIATVTPSGVVKGISQGTVTIRANSFGGVQNEVKVTVRTRAQTLEFTEVTPALYMDGETGEFTVKVTSPEGSNDTIKWSTSNRRVIDIIDVSADGKTITIQSGKKG